MRFFLCKLFRYRKKIHDNPIIKSFFSSYELRKKRVFFGFLFSILTVSFSLLLIFCYMMFSKIFFLILFFSIILYFLMIFLLYHFMFHYALFSSTSLKQEFFNILNSELFRDISYDPDGGIRSDEYENAGFQLYDVFRSEDYMEGEFFQFTYRMSEVHTFMYDKQNKMVPKFQGLVSVIPLSMPDDFFLSIGDHELHLFKSILISSGNKTFDRKFDILSNNEELTLQFLTDDVIREILNLSSKTGIKFEIKLCNQFLYIRFFTGDLFEMPHSPFLLSFRFVLWENILLQTEKIMSYLQHVFVV